MINNSLKIKLDVLRRLDIIYRMYIVNQSFQIIETKQEKLYNFVSCEIKGIVEIGAGSIVYSLFRFLISRC